MRKRAIDSVAGRLGHGRGGAQLFIPSDSRESRASQHLAASSWKPPRGKRNPGSLLPRPHPAGVRTPFARDAIWSTNPRVGPRLCTLKRRDLEGGRRGWREPRCWSHMVPSIPRLQDGDNHPGGGWGGVWGRGLKCLRHRRKASKEIRSLLASRGNACLLAGLQTGAMPKLPPPARGSPSSMGGAWLLPQHCPASVWVLGSACSHHRAPKNMPAWWCRLGLQEDHLRYPGAPAPPMHSTCQGGFLNKIFFFFFCAPW